MSKNSFFNKKESPEDLAVKKRIDEGYYTGVSHELMSEMYRLKHITLWERMNKPKLAGYLLILAISLLRVFNASISKELVLGVTVGLIIFIFWSNFKKNKDDKAWYAKYQALIDEDNRNYEQFLENFKKQKGQVK